MGCNCAEYGKRARQQAGLFADEVVVCEGPGEVHGEDWFNVKIQGPHFLLVGKDKHGRWQLSFFLPQPLPR